MAKELLENGADSQPSSIDSVPEREMAAYRTKFAQNTTDFKEAFDALVQA